ncbi:cytochrome b5-like [Chelonus insularis]|uniref:cytochrome b5-like n=1 Tax=Chelonus insularis TaxID=460826 RepID=UPI0015888ED6|nr:cytochrome b5-like [Chelonus insularis]
MSKALFSLEKVAQHNGQLGAKTWIVIKDVVYDVSNYLESHPGGAELLLEYAGKDATAAFYDFGHSSNAKNTLQSYKIGELIEEDREINRKKKINKKAIIIQDDIQKTKKRNRILLRITFFHKCVN